MDAPDPPPAPDPKVTADAQAGMNRDTAQAQQLTNAVNQVTPDGSLTYTQGGDYSYVGSDGKTVTIPRLTATQALSAGGQKLYDTNMATKQAISQIGLDQSQRIGGLLGSPVDLSNDATEQRLIELGNKRLQPLQAQQEETLRARLSNQGLQPGSEAWNREMAQFGRTSNDAIDQLILQGHGQAVQEALTQRNQPINEISALLSGSQVSQPNFVGTPQASIASPDYMGAVQNQYQAQLGAWNAQNQQNNAFMGGLFGLAGAGLSAFSDRRLKRDIDRVGSLANGISIYTFRYVWSKVKELGVMAQEVLAVRPQAVSEVGGFLMVDYTNLEG